MPATKSIDEVSLAEAIEASKGKSYAHHCRYISSGKYEIVWHADYFYTKRGFLKRIFSRITNERGARRFCKKWSIPFDEVQRIGAAG